MSRKENLISKLHTKEGTWKIAVWIIDMWHVNKHNGRQTIEMVLMDQTVIFMFFNFIGFHNWKFSRLSFVTVAGCKDWRHSDKNCSLNLSQSCIAIVHIWLRTSKLLTIILNTKWVQFHFWFIINFLLENIIKIQTLV